MSNANSVWARAEAVCEPLHRAGGGQGLAPKEKKLFLIKGWNLADNSAAYLLCKDQSLVFCQIKIVWPIFVVPFNGTEQIFLEWMLNFLLLCQVVL